MVIHKVTTGIRELDTILKGGLPEPSTLLILGDVGSGKSVICQQFAYVQAKNGYSCIYFCIDLPPKEVRINMKTLNWNPDELEEKGLVKFVDLFAGREGTSDERYQGNVRDFEELVSIMRKFFRDGKRFIIDSISTIAFIHGESRAYDLIQKVHAWTIEAGGVCIVNAVKDMHSKSFEIAIQQALGNAVLLEREGDEVFIRVTKTTKTSHKRGRFGLEIDESGIRILGV